MDLNNSDEKVTYYQHSGQPIIPNPRKTEEDKMVKRLNILRDSMGVIPSSRMKLYHRLLETMLKPGQKKDLGSHRATQDILEYITKMFQITQEPETAVTCQADKDLLNFIYYLREWTKMLQLKGGQRLRSLNNMKERMPSSTMRLDYSQTIIDRTNDFLKAMTKEQMRQQ